MARLLYILAAMLVLCQGALGHFELTYPKTRGFDEDKEPNAPCGGFNSATSRTQFPLKNGFVEINAGHPSYTYSVNLLINNNPSAADFTPTNLKQVAQGQRNYPQAACLPLDFSSVAEAKNGVNATIQVLFNGGDGQLYQCTDVTLMDNPSGFNSSMCINAQSQSAATSLSITTGLLVVVLAVSVALV